MERLQKITFPDGRTVGNWETERMMETILGDLDLRGKTVLEVGCREGVGSLWLNQHGATVWAFDIDLDCRPPFDETMEAFGVDLDFHLMDIESPNHEIFPIWPASVVTMLGVIYHVPNPILALENAWSATQEVLVIESEVLVDEKRSLMKFAGGEQNGNWDETCCWVPSPSCLRAMVDLLPGVHRVDDGISWMPSRRRVLRVWR
jgi:2-polyprenyl-3-methyl-5-hydroxy-6-metoxy-1,4-benzoquinol methylase